MEPLTIDERRERWFADLLRELTPGFLTCPGFQPCEVEEMTVSSQPGSDVVLRPWRPGGTPLPVVRVVKVLIPGPRRLVVYDHRGFCYRLQRDDPFLRGRNGTRATLRRKERPWRARGAIRER